MTGRTREIGWFRRPKTADWVKVFHALERTDLMPLKNRPIGTSFPAGSGSGCFWRVLSR